MPNQKAVYPLSLHSEHTALRLSLARSLFRTLTASKLFVSSLHALCAVSCGTVSTSYWLQQSFWRISSVCHTLTRMQLLSLYVSRVILHSECLYY